MAHQSGKPPVVPLNRTPPTRPPEDEAKGQKYADRGYGQNDFPRASSDVPGGIATQSALATNLRQSTAAGLLGDDILDAVQQHGTARHDSDFMLSPQTRDPSGLGKPKGYDVGVHPSMSRQQNPDFLKAAPTLPTKLNADEEQPARQPPAR